MPITGLIVVVAGCGAPTLKPVQDDPTGGFCAGPGPRLSCETPTIVAARDLDLLFVIDNSASMGEEQAKLAAAIPSLTRALAARDVDLRVGVTSGDMGNPRCTEMNFPRAPDRGQLVRESCRDHLGDVDGVNDFAYEPGGLELIEACTQWCDAGVHAALQGAFAATSVEGDETLRPRPWYQELGALTNLPAGVEQAAAALPENQDDDPDNDVSALAAALRCGLPLGINGCGFESPLEAMYTALARADEPEEDSYGFMRDAAALGVMLVSDAVDCSYVEAQKSIFLDLNNDWSWEPGASSPTSAVCWNAGVQCVGESPGPYSECVAVDRGIDGAQLGASAAASEAVLHPLSRYVDALTEIEDYKKQIDYNREIVVGLLSGVPVGYAEGAAELVYEDDADADAQVANGIGPGCEHADGGALPPVRMRELAEAFATGERATIDSLCVDDYAGALEGFADELLAQIKPSCFRSCVDDTDRDTPVLDPECEVEVRNATTGDAAPALECEPDPETGEPAPPEGETVCVVYRYDVNGETASDDDDLSPECVEDGWNLEIHPVWTEPLAAGTYFAVSCALSDLVQRDCPGLL